MREPEPIPGESGSDGGLTPQEIAGLSSRAEGGSGVVDRTWLDQVWQEHRRWVAAILLAYKPRDVDLDDLLQEVAFAIVRHGKDLRDAGAVRPWLRTVAINAARASARSEKLRRHARLDGPEGSIDPADSRGAWDGDLNEEARRILDLAMQLPEGYREPLLMKSLRDMSYRQIGEAMGLPETTVETRIARARRMLRDLQRQDEIQIAESAIPRRVPARS
ncbi:MAG: sigma-70 family RNA polymerase sigma factor [Planctomycetes bacterium]|nr:sigma-70 family RNA polymerase sigma factor [Planctomycetota bacterium]